MLFMRRNRRLITVFNEYLEWMGVDVKVIPLESGESLRALLFTNLVENLSRNLKSPHSLGGVMI
jgi:hypothetical protein